MLVRYDEDLEEEGIMQYGSEGEDFVMALASSDAQGNIVMVGSTQSESLTQEHMFADQTNGSEFRVPTCGTLISNYVHLRVESWTHGR